jgi:hypothetical protein
MQVLGKRKDMDRVKEDDEEQVDDDGLIPFDVKQLGGNVRGHIVFSENRIKGADERINV